MSNEMVGNIEKLREKIFEDQAFRERLMSNISKTLEENKKELGIPATPQNVALIKNVVDAINNLYDGFGEHDRFVT